MFAALRARARSDRGTTVVELLVTMAVMAIIVGAVITVWNAAQQGEGTTTSRSVDLNSMRIAMQRMSKDIRQASSVHTQTAASFDADTYIQLKDFKEGRRQDPQMTPVVADLSRDDMIALGNWFAAQKDRKSVV